MAQSTRKKKVVKNVISQSVFSIIQAIMSFTLRKIFLIYLSKELLGLNSLLTSVIGALSIAELGVGEAINFSLYKPLANDDKEMIKSIMRLYQKVYILIGTAIVVLGFFFMPFLHLVVKETVPMGYVYKVYLIFLADTFLSYFLAYSRNVISADQKDYIVTNVDTIAQVITTILQIVVLVITKNYIVYLLVKIIVLVTRDFYLHKKSLTLFAYLKEKNIEPLSKDYMKKLFENIKALFIIKIAYFCVAGTDNILLSTFVSLTSVAIYANYISIISIINKAFNTVFDKARASIGNYLETENIDKSYGLFRKMFFVNFVFTSYTCMCMFILMNEVITVWLGSDYVWSVGIVGILACNNYFRYILQSCEAFRGAAGLYSPKSFVKYLSLIEGIINLIVSVFLIKAFNMGIYGVFIGTFVSTFVSTIGVPWIVYRFLFKKPLIQYYILYLKYGAGGLLATSISYFIFKLISVENPWLNILSGGVTCTVIMSIVYILFYHKSDEYKYFKDIIMGKIKRKGN